MMERLVRYRIGYATDSWIAGSCHVEADSDVAAMAGAIREIGDPESCHGVVSDNPGIVRLELNLVPVNDPT